MECETLIRTDLDGTKHYKPKKAYDTLEEAIAVAKRVNIKEQQITKLVAYKCNNCCKYHIGRNGKELSKKEKVKYFKDVTNSISLKLVGKIEL